MAKEELINVVRRLLREIVTARFEGGESIRAFGDDIGAGIGDQRAAQCVTHLQLVVGDQYA